MHIDFIRSFVLFIIERSSSVSYDAEPGKTACTHVLHI